jgi:hypothetical protein
MTMTATSKFSEHVQYLAGSCACPEVPPLELNSFK